MTMTRATEEEREALRRAAEAASPILAKLRQQRGDLDRRIARLEMILSAYDETLGKRRRAIADDQPVMAKMRRGQVGSHIDAVLGGGADYTEPELRAAIFKTVGISYTRSSVYAVLKRGEKAGRYELKDGKRWRMKS
jgi:hypothetical protein